MILIDKQESFVLREHIPDVVISQTSRSKKSNRRKYWVEPTKNVLIILKKIRNVNYIET